MARFRLNKIGRDFIKANISSRELEETTIYADLCREAEEFANTTPEDCAGPNGYAYINVPDGILSLSKGCFDGPHRPSGNNHERRHESLGAEVAR